MTGSENIGQATHLRRLDDIDPGPLLVEDVLEEELQAITVDLDGAPRMALHQGGEVFLELFDTEPVWTTIEPLGGTARA
jgi:hypothetical protein